LVEAEAAKRGEGGGLHESIGNGGSSSLLLDNADAILRKEMEDEARMKLDAARSSSYNNNGCNGALAAGVLQPTAKLASQMSGARGRLATPTGTPIPTPPASGAGFNLNGVAATNSTLGATATGGGIPKLVLRKPTTSAPSASRLLKKGSSLSASSKLRVNKITSNDDDGFEDVETTQRKIEETNQQEEEDKRKRIEEDAKLARELQEKFDSLGTNTNHGMTTVAAVPEIVAPALSSEAAAAISAAPKMSAMEENMKKLSSMNSDFFSGL
jgi:hypothetical protein